MLDLIRQEGELWDLFARKEEYEIPDRDRYDRFPYYRSHHRNIDVPRVSQMLVEEGFCCEYPEGQPFAICLTHDIDRVYTPFFAKSLEIITALKNRNVLRARQIVPQLRSKRRPEWNFKEIARLEETYSAHSSFFFLTQTEEAREYAYAIEDLEQEMCMLQDGGWEIGLHGGCEAYRDLKRLQMEKQHLEKVLNRKVVGYRSHFLRFQVPNTWELLEKAGFQYDTTLGYTDCVGFRNGMCHPFRPFNLSTGQEMEILEIPLVIMDQALLSYMRLNPEQAWKQTERLLNTVERHHGVITLLWHNTYMADIPLQFYQKILKHGHDKGAWMTSGNEIEAWWRKNGLQFPLRQ